MTNKRSADAQAPAPRWPRIAIAAPVRQEARYLIEWIAWHRTLGVDEFIIGDNGGDDGTSALVQRLAAAGVVRRLDFVGRKYFQTEFMRAAIAAARAREDALIFVDADEFIRVIDPLSNSIDPDWYLAAYPDVAAAQVDAQTHYLEMGWREGRNPNAWFDTRFYLSIAPGAAEYAEAGGTTPLDHYERIGWRGGLDPSPRFSTRDYLARHSDAMASGFSPLGHFLRNGGAAAAPRASTLREIVADYLSDPRVGAVALNWAIYGSDGRIEAGDGLVVERFQRRARQAHPANAHAKSLVRPSACRDMLNPHAARLKRRWPRKPWRYVDASGGDVAWGGYLKGITARPVWSRLRIDHFIVKSREEFAIRRARGSASHPKNDLSKQRLEYFDMFDGNDVFDPAPPDRITACKREMAVIEAAIAAGRDGVFQ